jgi:hypothetical protein
MRNKVLVAAAVASVLALPQANATPQLIAVGTLSGSISDKSTETAYALENGVAGNLLGGIGSGLAWAGGSTFLALPDRGPNAVTYNAAVDNTTSYVTRFQTLTLALAHVQDSSSIPGQNLPYALTPTLKDTTLLYGTQALTYGTGGTPPINDPASNVFYFTGRSDGFDPAQSSANPLDARFDPEGIRVSNDGRYVYVSDEYGPYVYQFDRATGARLKTFTLPANLAVSNLSSAGNTEISGNSAGRVANKGMEGLAITPDGKTLVGFMQSPLIQDGGDGGRYNRIVTIDIATGVAHEYAYDNRIGTKNYNSSELLAINDHQFLVLERDGKGRGDGSVAAVKQIYEFDIAGAEDVTNISGASNLASKAVGKTLFLDIKAALNGAGLTDELIPAKLEGMAFGEDIMIGGVPNHTLYVANDNDFLGTTTLPNGTTVANPNNFFVFAFTDADLNGAVFQNQQIPLPATPWLMIPGLMAMRRYTRKPG